MENNPLQKLDSAAPAMLKGVGSGDITSIVSLIINSILGFVGLIFLILIIYAGFTWMTARDNPDQVKKSKTIIINSIIGIFIVVASYAIVNAVLIALGL